MKLEKFFPCAVVKYNSHTYLVESGNHLEVGDYYFDYHMNGKLIRKCIKIDGNKIYDRISICSDKIYAAKIIATSNFNLDLPRLAKRDLSWLEHNQTVYVGRKPYWNSMDDCFKAKEPAGYKGIKTFFSSDGGDHLGKYVESIAPSQEPRVYTKEEVKALLVECLREHGAQSNKVAQIHWIESKLND